MRKKIIAGNWKMHMQMDEGLRLAFAIKEASKNLPEELDIVLAPPYIHFYAMYEMLKNHPDFFLAAQNCHQEESGAYTGEVSAPMLASVGAEYVILGHSERRGYFKETDELVNQKIHMALTHDMSPIVCVGEPLDVRNKDDHLSYVKQQLNEAIFPFKMEMIQDLVLAYEPIWAIGTGYNAGPEQAQEMHKYIRELFREQYSRRFANNLTILYGGSCKPSNADELFAQPDIDGGLIGGASLNSKDFKAIINSYINSSQTS